MKKDGKTRQVSVRLIFSGLAFSAVLFVINYIVVFLVSFEFSVAGWAAAFPAERIIVTNLLVGGAAALLGSLFIKAADYKIYLICFAGMAALLLIAAWNQKLEIYLTGGVPQFIGVLFLVPAGAVCFGVLYLLLRGVKARWAVCSLLAVYLALVAWGVCRNTTLFFPMETQLARLTGYEEAELLLSRGGSHIFRTENHMLCFTQVTRNRFLWIPMPYTIQVRADFNLDTRTVEHEAAWFQNGSPYPNEYAQEARRLYAYQIYGDIQNGAPTFDFYMGVSETEPSCELLEQAAGDGDTIRDLQYAEVDGLYVFMFDEVYGDG